MDPLRFDHLTRLLGRAGGRRGLLGSLVGAALGGAIAETTARKRGKGKDKNRGRDKARDQDRERDQELQAERRRTGGKRRKHKQKRRGGSDGGEPEPPPADCCGTRSCPDPEPGSTRAGCDFAGQSFAGQDLNGSIFRGIDGRGTNFNATDNQGSVFAEACLQGARFRRAKLGGSTWGDACLFDADFTGADLGGDSAVFNGALFCNTVMPDGSVNDRDCERSTPCCQPRVEPGPSCQSAADCADQPCQTKACQNGTCVYDAVFSGPSPNTLCTFCCETQCCLAPATQCNTANACCVPNCAGRVCGPDGCGGAGTCGPDCPITGGQRCDATGQCVCDAISCPDGCCDANETCQPGGANGACGSGGRSCQNCQQLGDECVAGVCVCTAQSCPDGCCDEGPGNPGRCFPNQAPFCGVGGAECAPCSGNNTCNARGECVCAPTCAGKTCGPDGCGGNCGTCRPGETCDESSGQCRCTANSCPSGQQCCGGRCGLPNGSVCCQPGDCCSANCFNNRCADLVATCGGAACDTPSNGCAEGLCCGDPAAFSCGVECCGPPATACGAQGGGCITGCRPAGESCCQNTQCCDGVCCEGICCGPRGQCQGGQCVCVPKTCAELGRQCGTAPDGCGGTLECGVCPIGPTPSCKDGVCVSCPEACPGCPFCVNLTSGETQCGSDDFAGLCTLPACSTNASCTDPEFPVCLASVTDPSNQTTTAQNLCPGVGATAVCAFPGEC